MSSWSNSGSPYFETDAVKELAGLKTEEPSRFETLRTQLKKVGCRVTALDEAIAKESGTDGRHSSQADVLVNLATICTASAWFLGSRYQWSARVSSSK